MIVVEIFFIGTPIFIFADCLRVKLGCFSIKKRDFIIEKQIPCKIV